MKGTKSKKLIVSNIILGIVASVCTVWIVLTVIFHMFGKVIWGYPRPPWVGQFIFIGIVLMIIEGIILGIVVIAKLVEKSHRKK